MILAASITVVDGPSGPMPFPTVDAYVWATVISLVVSVVAAAAAFSVPRSGIVDDPVDCS